MPHSCEEDNNQPLFLKPHHICAFRRLVIGIVASTVDQEIAGIAKRAEDDAEKIRNNSSSDYRKDLLGETPQGFRSYVESLINAALEFHHSPDTRVVQISERKKDMFCNACVIGNHCERLSTARREELKQFYIDDFFNFVRAVPEASGHIKIESHPIEGTKSKEKILMTDVGTLKRIFRNPVMDYRMY